jgi:two-component system phosphate regulon sensor histidine kinase PhoR
MLKTFRAQIFVTFIVFISCLFLLTALVTVRLVENHQMLTIREALVREANIISYFLMKHNATEASPDIRKLANVVEPLHERADARVTLIDRTGKVWGDSDAPAAHMDNHANRPEIMAAAQTGLGTAVRKSATTGEHMLYVALPLKNEGQTVGFIRLANSLDNVKQYMEIIISSLVVVFFGLFLLSILVLWRISRSLSEPVHEIRTVAEQIALGQYADRVGYTKANEMGHLGRAINEMADSLQQQMDRLTDSEHRLKNVLDHLPVGVALTDYNGSLLLFNPFFEMFTAAGSVMNGEKLQQLNVPLEFSRQFEESLEWRAARQFEFRLYYPEERVIDAQLIPIGSGMVVTMRDLTAIRRLEKLRSEFVANVSHELRTPLAAIRGFAETLQNGALHDTNAAEAFLQIIIDESDRLNRLVNDLLELSRIETKRVPLIYESIRLGDLLHEVRGLLEVEAERRQLQVLLDGDMQLTLEADRDRFRQIVINLLHNSIQYTPNGGDIHITWRATEGALTIEISDTGIGIPSEDLAHVFERFFRVDRDRNRQSGGTGLGLAITKHLVELHRGSIRVSSRVGEGSTFTVTLPCIQGE